MLAPALLAVVMSAAPSPAPLAAAERAYFGAQLASFVAAVRAGLAATGMTCERSAAPDGKAAPPEKDLAAWVGETAGATGWGTAPDPAGWQAFLVCREKGFEPMRLGVALSATPSMIPAQVVGARNGGAPIRVTGEDAMLCLGACPVFDGKELPALSPPAEPPALAVAAAALVYAEGGRGKPRALDVVRRLDAAALQTALARLGALPRPPDSRPAPATPPPPELEGTEPVPAEAPYRASGEPAPRPVEVAVSKGDRMGLLHRKLTPDERAYFATVESRAARAIVQGFRNAGIVCGYAPSRMSDPDDGAASPAGFGPRHWQLGVLCAPSAVSGATAPGGGGRGPLILVTLSPGWYPPGTSSFSRTVVAPDAVLFRTAKADPLGGLALLHVGRPAGETAEGKLRLSPGVARLGAVELSGSGYDGGAALVEKLDLTPIRSLLAAPPAPPAGPPAAVEGPPAAGPREEVEVEVYRAVLAALEGSWVVDRDSSVASLSPSAVAVTGALAPDLLPSAAADFNAVAAASAPLPADLGPGDSRHRLTGDEQKALFAGHRGDGWRVFREKYPGASGMLGLSRVGLSRDRTQAVVQVSWSSNWLAAAGGIWFLRKTEAGWVVAWKMALWVS